MIARGITEAVLTSLGAKRLDKKNHNPAPLVVVLAGNNRTGAYSLGAGRWLSIRGIRVLAVICSTEGEELEVFPHLSKPNLDYPHPIQTLQSRRGKTRCHR
jgi:YjeF-related protein N-terminus